MKLVRSRSSGTRPGARDDTLLAPPCPAHDRGVYTAAVQSTRGVWCSEIDPHEKDRSLGPVECVDGDSIAVLQGNVDGLGRLRRDQAVARERGVVSGGVNKDHLLILPPHIAMRLAFQDDERLPSGLRGRVEVRDQGAASCLQDAADLLYRFVPLPYGSRRLQHAEDDDQVYGGVGDVAEVVHGRSQHPCPRFTRAQDFREPGSCPGHHGRGCVHRVHVDADPGQVERVSPTGASHIQCVEPGQTLHLLHEALESVVRRAAGEPFHHIRIFPEAIRLMLVHVLSLSLGTTAYLGNIDNPRRVHMVRLTPRRRSMSHFVAMRRAVAAAKRLRERVDPRFSEGVIPTLSPAAPGQAMKVGIAGAGISGLVAASMLEQAGHQVTIFEARDRVGGRIHTLDLADDGTLLVDAGASRVPASHTHTLTWLRRVGVDYVPKYPERGRLVHLRGEDRRVGRDIEALSNHAIHRAISHGEGSDLLERSGARTALDLARDTWRKPFWYRVPGGAARLPRGVAETLKRPVRLDTPVSAITQHADEVVVTSPAGTDSFDRVLVAVPVSLYETISFTPELPVAKRKRLQDARTQPSLRAFVVTRGRESLAGGANGWGSTDGGMELWHFSSAHAPDRMVHVLYAQGAVARPLVAASQRERESRLLEVLENAFPGLGDHVEAVHSHCWNDDPWALGAQTVNRRGAWEDISAPVGRVHFAGEGTAPRGWIDGTIASTYRALMEMTPTRNQES